jgi:predicted lactoylglutathione lyase
MGAMTVPRMIFVNLPVADVARSTAFYEALGFTRNAAFSNEHGAAMVWSETISFMLLDHGFFGGFTSKRIIDAKSEVQALMCLSIDSREAVDALLEAAIAAGAVPDPDPPHDEDFMYGRSYEDPDGHLFQVMWMDPAAMPSAA